MRSVLHARPVSCGCLRHGTPFRMRNLRTPRICGFIPPLSGAGFLVSGRSAVSVIGATAFPAASCGSASGVPCLVFHPGIRPFPSAPVPFSVSGGTLFLSFSPLPFSSSRIRFPALPVPRFPARVFSSFLRKKENVAFPRKFRIFASYKLCPCSKNLQNRLPSTVSVPLP